MKKILIGIIMLIMSIVSFSYANTRYSSNVEVVGIVVNKNSIRTFVSTGVLLVRNPETNAYSVYEDTNDNLIIDYVYGGNVRISKDEIRPNYWMRVESIEGWMTDNNLVLITQEEAVKILNK